MMRKLRWCDLAVVEVSGRSIPSPERAPNQDVPWNQRTPQQRADREGWWDRECAWRKTPAAGGGQLDVLALTLPGWKPELNRTRPRIAIVEVKVTRSDLLSDLRAGKLLKYEPQATHVYLALANRAMLRPYQYTRPSLEEWADDLRDRGLPDYWGLVYIPTPTGFAHNPVALRNPGRNPHACDPTPELRRSLAVRAAVSLAHRAAD